MKKYAIIFILLLCTAVYYLFMENKRINSKYEVAVENIKAYDSQLSSSKEESRMFKLTIDQLDTFSDSILQEMNEARKEMKIKDKELLQLQYEKTILEKRDSLISADTLFIKNVNIDTIIGDKWVNTRLILRYPSSIYLNTTSSSEKIVAIGGKRELVNPKRNKVARWFQQIFGKKHTVVEVNIREKNPYIKTDKSRYIQIVK